MADFRSNPPRKFSSELSQLYPKIDASETLPLVYVWATIEELIAAGYFLVVSAARADRYWEKAS